MQHDELIKSVTNLGIYPYFDFIGGIGDHYGGGKIENARNYLAESGWTPCKPLSLIRGYHSRFRCR
ncbi:MAG: hypothetical protein U0Z17_10825 [Bacteroidales bacterium]